MIFATEDIFVDAPRPTPLYAAAASVSEANLWTSVNGWTASRVYSSVAEEYDAACNNAVIGDFGPMARYAVRGNDAAQFLARLTTAPAISLHIGEGARGLLLTDEGHVIDLAEVSRLSEELFLVTFPGPHARRVDLAARGMDVEVQDISSDVAALGIMGPQTGSALNAAGLKSVSETFAASSVLRGVETATRPLQFGGIQGVELIFPKDEALTIWERIIRRSMARPIGLDAMEILRLESGVPRSGLDFIPADRRSSATKRTPEELGLAHLAPLDGGWFNGRRALRKSAGRPERRLISLSLDAEETVPGAGVYLAGKNIGRITSCGWSPSRKRVLAFADIGAACHSPEFEVSMAMPGEKRVLAKPFETTESVLERQFSSEQGRATDFRR
ncbi:glycine cleavage T C-terminal barrel domain-containing protein [Hyphococcus formosus]|uniref:glycine cleavage T C-terminal barrel domain-containing protein n=1 Tax=Hyphococcus formosus TaxID=3143534 RepID=UPI00398A712A